MEIQITQILFQVINFGIIAFVLVKFLYQPISKVLEERSEKIAAGQKAAEESLKAKESIKKDTEKELQIARSEAKKILEEAKSKAEAEAAAIISKAKEEAKMVIGKEKAAFDASMKDAKDQALHELKDLVVKTTAKVLRNSLSTEDQHKIIDAQLKTL